MINPWRCVNQCTDHFLNEPFLIKPESAAERHNINKSNKSVITNYLNISFYFKWWFVLRRY